MSEESDLSMEMQLFALALREEGAISHFVDSLDPEDVGAIHGNAGVNQFYIAISTFYEKTGLDPIDPIAFKGWLKSESDIFTMLGGEEGVGYFFKELEEISELSKPEAVTSVLRLKANKKRQSTYLGELTTLLEKKDKSEADATRIKLLTSMIQALEDRSDRDPYAKLMTGEDFADRADRLWDLPDVLETPYSDLNRALGYSDDGGVPKGAITAVLAQSGQGKALALDTPIPTPDGWTVMGDLEVGDTIFGADGKTCKVVKLSPIFKDHDCFRVTFSDQTHIIADADHQWEVERPGQWNSSRVKTTREVFDYMGEGYVRVPAQGSLDTRAVDLPVDPYTLGLQLGDNDSNHGERIPSTYLRSSLEQRKDLAQGLMDAVDGGGSEMEFDASDHALAEDVLELLRSLGIKASLAQYEVGLKLEYDQTDNSGRTIESVVPVDTVPTRCIEVDSPDHLYLAGEGMVPTHNSTFAKCLANHWVENGYRVLYVNYEETEDHWARILMTQVTGKNAYMGAEMSELDIKHTTEEFKAKMEDWGDNLMVLQDPDTPYFEDLEGWLGQMRDSDRVPDAIIIDTIQSIFLKSSQSGGARWNQYEEMMVRLEKLGKELGSAIIITAQENTNRLKENRTVIKASDTGGSIAIVQKSSVTMHLVGRESVDESAEEGLVDIQIPKNRITGQSFSHRPPTVRYDDETKTFEAYDYVQSNEYHDSDALELPGGINLV